MARAMRLRLLRNVGFRHLEHATPDDAWPASTLPEDFAHGIELYRANVRPRMRQPAAGFTETPVQIVVPLHDRYITPALLEGLEEWSSAVWRREVDAGHWVIRTDPVLIADAVRQMVAFAEHGTEDEELARWRLH
jgi:pimeloyl-ACP methyl ester carboxylesterase